MPTPKPKPTPLENAEHRALADWLDRHGYYWEHVPNGGARTKSSGSTMRSLGARAGSPDFRIYDPRPPYVGAAVEMKRQTKGVVSTPQNAFLAALAARGWATLVARGADDAVRQLSSLGYR